jgi:hypothetical protein
MQLPLAPDARGAGGCAVHFRSQLHPMFGGLPLEPDGAQPDIALLTQSRPDVLVRSASASSRWFRRAAAFSLSQSTALLMSSTVGAWDCASHA